MKHLIALLVCASAAAAFDNTPCTVDIYALGLSKHLTGDGYRESNPGLGIGFSGRVNEHLEVATVIARYLDSYDRAATVVGVGPRIGYGDRWRVTGALLVGDMQGSGRDGVAAIPVIGVGHRYVSVELSALDTDVFAGWLRIAIPVVE